MHYYQFSITATQDTGKGSCTTSTQGGRTCENLVPESVSPVPSTLISVHASTPCIQVSLKHSAKVLRACLPALRAHIASLETNPRPKRVPATATGRTATCGSGTTTILPVCKHTPHIKSIKSADPAERKTYDTRCKRSQLLHATADLHSSHWPHLQGTWHKTMHSLALPVPLTFRHGAFVPTVSRSTFRVHFGHPNLAYDTFGLKAA